MSQEKYSDNTANTRKDGQTGGEYGIVPRTRDKDLNCLLSDRQRWQFKHWLCLVMTCVHFLWGPQECSEIYIHIYVTSVHIWRCVLHMRSVNKERISFPILYIHTKPLSFKVDLNKLYCLQYTLHWHYHWRYRWFHIFIHFIAVFLLFFFFNWKWTAFSLTDESWIFLVMEKISNSVWRSIFLGENVQILNISFKS